VSINRVELTARLLESDGLRHTPSGLPVLQLRLMHASPQTEAGRERQVECEVEAQVFGDLAARMAKLAQGDGIVCKGFLDRKSARNLQLVLHVTEFELV
jgi:primosomal replication protein N